MTWKYDIKNGIFKLVLCYILFLAVAFTQTSIYFDFVWQGSSYIHNNLFWNMFIATCLYEHVSMFREDLWAWEPPSLNLFRRDVILRNSNTTRKHKSRMAFTLNCPFSCIQLCRLSCWNTLDVCKFRKKFICKLQNVEFLCVPIPPFLWQHLKKQRTQDF